MDSSVVQYENKLKKLLTKFLEPGYRLGNDVYLNILLSHLSGKKNEAQSEELKRLPIFTEWLETAVTQWETTQSPPSSSIATFTLNLCSLISTNESNFIRLNNTNVFLRLCKVLKLRSMDIGPSVKLGYLKMLHSFMKHKSGLEWLLATDHWADILGYCLENQTIYITRDGYIFMYDLLSKFINIHPTFCELIVKKILYKLQDDQFNVNGVRRSEIDDVQLVKDLMPTLKLINYILEKCFLANTEYENDTIPNIFVKLYNLEETLWKLLLISRDCELLFNISKPLYIISFQQIDVTTMHNRECSMPEITKFMKKFLRLFNTLITKRSPINILKLCHLGHIYWKKLSILLPSCKPDKQPLVFENQIILYQIMPILYIAFSIAYKKDIEKDELTELFIHKLFKISCEHTIRCCYSYRALLMSYDTRKAGSSNDAIIFDFGQKAIYYLMKTRPHFQRERAVIVFQALMYAMKYLAKSFVNETETHVDISYTTGFLSAMFDGLSMLIKDFKITWRESVETICLTSLTLQYLDVPNLPTKIAVQCLQLINLSIANFMPPNLALLVNEVNDSSVLAIPPMLYKKLHDINWEIRDSALEILTTIVEISHLKFPAFQKMVLDAHLCQLAVVLSTDDGESFVRASAIKSVTAMIKVPGFWNDCLEYEQLPEKIMKIIQNESEGIVRCEAVKLICEIYEHQYIAADQMHEIYSSMASAVTQDLHWEVKVNSLSFWGKVICKEMSNQGMIDGVFPSVTFSKEHKKIVTLTEPEIQSRLNKVLINLSEVGCLGVLLAAMQDDCDLQVSKKSVEITKKLTNVLKKHNTLNLSNGSSDISRSCWDTFNNLSRTVSNETDTVMSDNIIESIVNSTDMNLLGSVYKENFKMDDHVVNGAAPKELIIIKPEDFKNFIAKDLDLMVDNRSKWLESVDDLNSLLDDILKSYEDNDVNSMDCY